ncbi:hypothetical protein SDC9_174469 [bioreactor metagenome]|uniref:Uncharacterized protein n=1 Tax=bioreactor metagenome TaxID=1076179 RepID=A0A645GME9_9ZZZZ
MDSRDWSGQADAKQRINHRIGVIHRFPQVPQVGFFMDRADMETHIPADGQIQHRIRRTRIIIRDIVYIHVLAPVFQMTRDGQSIAPVIAPTADHHEIGVRKVQMAQYP